MSHSEAVASPGSGARSSGSEATASFSVYEDGRLVGSSSLPAGFGVPVLVLTDGDSTLIQQEVIDELAKHAGVGDQVAAITESAMAGCLDFSASLRQRVALLKGLPVSALDKVRASLTLTPGAADLVRWAHRSGARFGVVSGGFGAVLRPLADDLGVDFLRANELEVADGRLTGRILGPIVDAQAKVRCLNEWSDGRPQQAVAVGDGANDVPMLQAAGVGFAFCAKPTVVEQTSSFLEVPRLDLIPALLGTPL